MRHILATLAAATLLLIATTAYAGPSRTFKGDNIEVMHSWIQKASNITGVDPWLLSGMISWETDAVLKEGRSIRGGAGDRFWGPGQIACTPKKGKFSWKRYLRDWHKKPSLRCSDLLKPEIGILSSAYVLRFLWHEIAFNRLNEAVKKKDRKTFLYIHSKYNQMKRDGYLDPGKEPRFFQALLEYGIEVTDRDILAHYSQGLNGPRYCERYRCEYVEQVSLWQRKAFEEFNYQKAEDNVCILRNVSHL